MGRLYRPHIPLAIRVQVAGRQLSERGLHLRVEAIKVATDTCGEQLAILLLLLSNTIGCKPADLRLDHDPALAARPKERRGLSSKTFYTPDANDPDHLFYRPHGPEHAGSHLIKTNVRGDNGQHPDRVLIKKQRRLEQGPKPKRQSQFSSPPMRSKKSTWPKRSFPKRADK